MTKKTSPSELVSNRAAFHHYEILDTIEAGIALLGTEVKSLREGGGNLTDNYVLIREGEAFLRGAHIAPYAFGNLYNHPEKRERKLLLHKLEIDKLRRKTQEKGLTIVALALYLKNGRVKVKLGVCKGKKTHDKREALKKKSQEREMRSGY